MTFKRLFLFTILPATFLGLSQPAHSQDENKFGGKTKAEWLVVLEKEPKPVLRKAAVLALGIIGPGQKDILPALIKALASDKDDGVRLQVITVMGVLDPKKELRDVLPTLADCLKDDKSPAVRAAAANLMGNLGENAKPALMTLIAALKDADAGVRAAAVETIGKVGPEAKAVINEMLPLLKDRDASVRFATVFTYGRLGAEAAFVVPDLLQVLEKDDSPDVRREVARALATVGPSTPKLVIPAMIKGLQTDKSEEVRRQLALSLGKMGDIRGVMKEVFDVIKADSDRTVRLYLVRSIPAALGSGLKDYVKEYAEWLAKEPEGDVRLAIVQELGALGPPAKEALEALMNAESDVVLQVREAAKISIMQIKGMPKKEPKK